MRCRRLAVVACLVSLLTVAIEAQPSDWTTVMALRSGQLVRVESSTESVRQGEYLRADSESLTVAVSRRTVTIPRKSVRRIYLVSERNVRRMARCGLLIGAAAGATLGALTAETNKGQWSAFMALGWGAFGAAIGALNGLDRNRVLVFQAPGSPSD